VLDHIGVPGLHGHPGRFGWRRDRFWGDDWCCLVALIAMLGLGHGVGAAVEHVFLGTVANVIVAIACDWCSGQE
jgi:hypothetical protein